MIFYVCFFLTFLHVNSEISYVPTACPDVNGIPQYFDSTALKCVSCGSGQIKSPSGLSCQCSTNYKTIKNFGGDIQCQACSSGQMTSEDGWSCVNCTGSGCTSAACSSGSVILERYINGTLRNEGNDTICLPCASDDSKPSPDNRRCVGCPLVKRVKPTLPASSNCLCTGEYMEKGGVCFPVSQTKAGISTKIDSLASGIAVEKSLFLESHLEAAYVMCKSLYSNRTACQMIGHACALVLFQRINVGSTTLDGCALQEDLAAERIKVTGYPRWPVNMTWLYYDTGTTILTSTDLTTVYKRLEQIRFLAAVYSMNGTFLGYKSLRGGLIQLCKNSEAELNAAYAFGTRYSTSCNINVDDLFDSEKFSLQFFDLFIQYTLSSGTEALLPVPIKILNYRLSASDSSVNRGSDSSKWQLVRRFFLVDNVATVETVGGRAKFVRYAESIEFSITLIELTKEDKSGKIYNPLVTINYAQVNSEDFGTGKTAAVSFKVSYEATQNFFFKDLEIAMAVLCSLAGIYSIFKTYVHFSRTSSQSFEGLLILQLLANACGAIANMFLLIMYIVCVWFFSVYKNQTVFAIFMPTVTQETNLLIYIGVACGLKIFEVVYMVFSQSFVDIFMIDWEQPKVTDKESQESEEVTFWRTILIANEWNEIQTHRKTNRIVTVLTVLFFMSVLGFENYATGDPQLQRFPVTDTYSAEHIQIFRFALAVSAFIVVGGVQWIITLLIMERFVEDKLRNFVDLCSVANVSVFIRFPSAFGYYIHGLSPHTTTDVGISTLNKQFEAEKTNQTGKRGLDGTDQQTFLMRLPPKFVNKFTQNALMISDSGDIAARAKAYQSTNEFLKRFIRRVGASSQQGEDGPISLNADGVETFIVKPRQFLEDALGVELGSQQDFQMRGVFYEDDGVSFGDILFYGNELSLITFDILVFVTVDLIFKSSALGAIIAWLLGEVLDFMRHQLSEMNLAAKTQIDRRFLI